MWAPSCVPKTADHLQRQRSHQEIHKSSRVVNTKLCPLMFYLYIDAIEEECSLSLLRIYWPSQNIFSVPKRNIYFSQFEMKWTHPYKSEIQCILHIMYITILLHTKMKKYRDLSKIHCMLFMWCIHSVWNTLLVCVALQGRVVFLFHVIKFHTLQVTHASPSRPGIPWQKSNI